MVDQGGVCKLQHILLIQHTNGYSGYGQHGKILAFNGFFFKEVNIFLFAHCLLGVLQNAVEVLGKRGFIHFLLLYGLAVLPQLFPNLLFRERKSEHFLGNESIFI